MDEMPSVDRPPRGDRLAAEIAIRNPEVVGRTLAELASRLPAGVMIAAIRQQHRNLLPRDELILHKDDVAFVEAETPPLRNL